MKRFLQMIQNIFFKEDMSLIIANYLDHRDGPDPCKEDDDSLIENLKYCLLGCQKIVSILWKCLCESMREE